LRSEASSRFEKGLDPELAVMGLNRAARLMAELCDGKVVPGVLDVYPQPVRPRHLRFSARDVEWLLGYPVSVSEVEDALRALEFGVVLDEAGHEMTVEIPTWRADVKEAADLVEEVGRVLGYDRITGHIPSGPLPEPLLVDWFSRAERVRDILVGAGLREIVTYPLTSRAAMMRLLEDTKDVSPLLTGAREYLLPTSEAPKVKAKSKGKRSTESADTASVAVTLPPERMPAIILANPLSTNLETLRLTLLVSLMETLATNAKAGAASMRLFEIGRRYIPRPDNGQLPFERASVGIALCGPAEEHWLGNGRDLDFFDLKAVAECLFEALHIAGARYTPTHHPTFHPGRCALIELAMEEGATHRPIGIMGEVHPTVAQRYDLTRRAYVLEIDLERLYEAAPRNPRFERFSRFPALTRDLAVVVDQNVPAEAIAAAIRSSGGELVQTVTLFDLYEGEQVATGKRSLAFTIVYQASDRTLSDADGDAEQARVVALLRDRFGTTIRE
jgi:phenylalanyl-tRNA synthetase beta chain